MTHKSHRLMYRFWLDMEKSEEEHIADKIELLKNERKFASTIRDGIRLVGDLREGRLDVLFELFPWVRAEFLTHVQSLGIAAPQQMRLLPAHHSDDSTENVAKTQRVEDIDALGQQYQQREAERQWLEAEQERLEQERIWQERRLEEARQALEDERRQLAVERAETQNAIHKQLVRLEDLLVQQGNQPIPMSADSGRVLQPNGGPKQLAVPQLTTPAFDDDGEDNLLEIRKDTQSGQRATQNFLKSLMRLNPDEATSKPVN